MLSEMVLLYDYIKGLGSEFVHTEGIGNTVVLEYSFPTGVEEKRYFNPGSLHIFIY
jgi:hypothetical protein